MSATTCIRNATWSEANQQVLSGELARIKELLQGGDGRTAEAAMAAARQPMEQPAAIDRLCADFGLSRFERELLLLTAGVEMDGEIAALCAHSPAGHQRPWASFGLALAVLGEPHWSALSPGRPLRHWRLIEASDDATVVNARLRIDERVLHHLAGVDDPDPRLMPLLLPVPCPTVMAPSQALLAERIAESLQRRGSPLPLVQLTGNDGPGQRDVAAAVAAQLGLRLFVLAAGDIPANPMERHALERLWEREASLISAALLVEQQDAPAGHAALTFLERVVGVTLVAGPEPLPCRREDLRAAVPKPTRTEQRALWQQAVGQAAPELGPVLEGLAAEFRFSSDEIQRLARSVCGGVPDPAEAGAALLWRACRGHHRSQLGNLAQRIESAACWDDLILPEAQQDTLRRIASQVQHRLTVYEHWGFASQGNRGLGISVLFAGESGTGKTMAAEVLARELQLDLYRINLAAVVSKYIGETEKNLAQVFEAAEDSGAILLFDEADALFGKRSEVKDSHDRHANIEVSYLLQRMESYRGLAILTTNQKDALDAAFQRRLRFVVSFPFPDAEQRAAIWRRVFPAGTPLDGVDPNQLARLQMAGGNIRNIALAAAFLAAEAGTPVGMEQLLAAAQSEASKRERPLAAAETRGWP